MRKLIMPAAVSFVLTLTGLLVNYLYYQNNQHLLLAYHVYGGEITRESGFGLTFIHTYAMTSDGGNSLSIRFSLTGFILTFLALTLIIWLAWTIFTALRKQGSAK